MHRLGIGEAHDGRRVESHPDLEALGEMLIGAGADEHGWAVPRRRARREATMLLEVALELRRIDSIFAVRGPGTGTEHGRELTVEIDQLLGDGVPLGRVRVQDLRAALATHHRGELPSQVERVAHRDVHALPRLGAVGVAGVAGDEHSRQADVGVGDDHVVVLGAEALPDLVHRPPDDLLDVQGVRRQDAPRRVDQSLDRDRAACDALVDAS